MGLGLEMLSRMLQMSLGLWIRHDQSSVRSDSSRVSFGSQVSTVC
jgi:hypothetical protein